jgi:hypothetical protein
MQPSINSEVFEIPLSTMWFDEDGIFCSVTKKDAALTKEALEDTFNFIRKNAGDKKILWLGDVTHASLPTTEARDFAGEETPKFVKALALITNSELSKMIANVFLVLKKPAYPTKLFTNKKDAKDWLQKQL